MAENIYTDLSIFGSLSATTFYSGSTPLSNIIQNFVIGTTSGLTSTQVQNGTNTYTGGTSSLPTVNVSALTISTLSASGTSVFNILSATTYVEYRSTTCRK